MLTKSLPLPSPNPSPAIRRKWEAIEIITNSKKANLFAERKVRVRLPEYADGQGKDFPIREFLAHPSGVESILNTRALQSFEPVGSNTYRCTLNKIQLLKFDAVPILDLRVTPTSEDCTVELLSCKFEGSKTVEQQNNHFSAFMINHMTWQEDGLEPCLEVNVSLKITLERHAENRERGFVGCVCSVRGIGRERSRRWEREIAKVGERSQRWGRVRAGSHCGSRSRPANSNSSSSFSLASNSMTSTKVYTKPFSLLPISVVEKPGNLVMQGLIDRLVPLLIEQLLKDYDEWVEEQSKLASQRQPTSRM